MMFVGYYSDILEQDQEDYGFLHLVHKTKAANFDGQLDFAKCPKCKMSGLCEKFCKIQIFTLASQGQILEIWNLQNILQFYTVESRI